MCPRLAEAPLAPPKVQLYLVITHMSADISRTGWRGKEELERVDCQTAPYYKLPFDCNTVVVLLLLGKCKRLLSERRSRRHGRRGRRHRSQRLVILLMRA